MLYLAMEYVEGRTLYDVIRQDAPLPEARIVDILSQVLAAVGVAHDMGVVHRDLKPENIMIIRGTSDEGEHAELVKVLDFGIASLGTVAHDEGAYAEGPRMTKRGLIVGTPEYMAPEQADGRAERRSDLYSLGVVLYQMLTGRLPFRGDSPLTVAVKHITEAPELPSQIAAVNPKLEAVCMRALGKTPDERYGSAREMRSALRAAINLAPSRASAPQTVISGADSQSGAILRNARRRRAAPPRAAGGRPCAGHAVRGGAGRAQLVGEVASRAGDRHGGGGGDPPAAARAGGERRTRLRRRPRREPTSDADETGDGKIPTMRGRRRDEQGRLDARDARQGPTRIAHARGAAHRRQGSAEKRAGRLREGVGAGRRRAGRQKRPKAGAAVTEPTAITPPVAPAPLDLGHASVSIASITSTSAIPGANIRAALSRSPLVRCYREALHATGAAATGTAVLHLKIDIAGYVTSTELEGAQFLPGVKPCVEKSTRGVRVKDVDTGEATADVTLTFACPP